MSILNPKQLTNQALVTIGVASYNHARYICETLNSILHQSYQNLEVIIHDDASKDESIEVIENWLRLHGDDRFRLIKNIENVGVCKSLNRIIDSSQGEYLAFIASDDRYLPDFVMNRVHHLTSSSADVGIVYSPTYLMNEQGERIGVEERNVWPSGWIFEEMCQLNNSICKPFTSLVRRKVYEQIGPYDETLIFEDLDFFFRASKQWQIKFVTDIDTEYRVLANSLGTTLMSTARGLDGMSVVLQKQLGVSHETDSWIARRLRKIAMRKKDLGFSAWQNDLKISNRYHRSMLDHLYLYAYPVMDLFRKKKEQS